MERIAESTFPAYQEASKQDAASTAANPDYDSLPAPNLDVASGSPAINMGSTAGTPVLSRIIWTNGGQQQSWSGHSFLYSCCQRDPQRLFDPILRQAMAWRPGRLVSMAVDDTRLRKSGRLIPGASYQCAPAGSVFQGLILGGFHEVSCSLGCHGPSERH